MVPTTPPADIAGLPPAPRNPLTLRQQIHAVKAFHTGQEVLRDAGGHVTRLKHGPTWLMRFDCGVTNPLFGHKTRGVSLHGLGSHSDLEGGGAEIQNTRCLC